MKVDLVKIDVEDFEAGLLAGMERTIRRDRPFIVCEIYRANITMRKPGRLWSPSATALTG
jgi:hypothetical protein